MKLCDQLRCHRGYPWIRIAMIIIIMIVLIHCRRVPTQPIVGNFTQKKELLTPNYKKELHLFQTMNPADQVEYLHLSRDQKLVKYGNKLL